MRCRSGSVRTSIIESEWRSPRRASPGAESVPSRRIVVGFVSTRPSWPESCLSAAGDRRLFASFTPSRNEK